MKRSLMCAVAVLTAVVSFADTDPSYVTLRAAHPDGRTIAVNNFVFDRDVYHITLNGTMNLLAPINGTTVGAVFIGRGSYDLTAAGDTERRMLAINADDASMKTLRDDFASMVIFDRDLIAQLAKTAASGAPNASATQVFDRFLKFEQKNLKDNIHIRVLQALLNNETTPLFYAFPDGNKYKQMMLVVDAHGYLDGEETALRSADGQHGGIWYSSHLRGEKAHPDIRLLHASHYAIDTTFRGHDEIAATTIIDATTTSGDVRVVPIDLDRHLRIEEAAFAADAKAQKWTPLSFVQENENEDGDAALIFPVALKPAESLAIRIRYRGKEVLKDAGDGKYYVRSRSNWYPNLGTFTELATYDLTYHFPKANQIVSVGELVDDRVEGDQRVVTFKAPEPIRVAGFNFGKFRKVSRTDQQTGLTVDVYTNPGTPDVIKEINQALESTRSTANSVMPADLNTSPWNFERYVGPHEVHLDTNGLAESALADAINTTRVAAAYFGISPQKHVSITQQSQWDYGQSWPGLVYLPYLAVLSGTTRAQFGLAGATDFIEQVGPHEMAHQWWGHTVGPATYHDVWLSEGFADFSAALVLQLTLGQKKFNDFWESSRRSILNKPIRAFIENTDAGPIIEGERLATWRNPAAYQALVYNKGAYVLHMLRMTMQDRSNKQNPDGAFIALMTDFMRTYAGRNATTDDFKRIVEKHMIKNLNADGNGTVDWFFNQWVYGTAIPKYSAKFDVKSGNEGKFHVSGSMTQAEVPDNFKVLVPLYAEFDKGQVFKIADIPMVGSVTRPLDFEIRMPKMPRAITVNAMHDVLAR